MRHLRSVLIPAVLFLLPRLVGAGWDAQSSGTDEKLNGVSFSDSDHGFVVGGTYTIGFSHVILRTTNGGVAWTILSSGGPGYSPLYEDVCFLNASTGTVVGAATWGPYGKGFYNDDIIRTTDAGISWRGQGFEYWFKGVYFINPDTGTVVGFNSMNGIIYHTTNGGAVWTPQDTGATHPVLNGVSFADAEIGTVVGDSGVILRTTNGGSNWAAQNSGTQRQLKDVSLINTVTGIAVGDSGIILRTTDGGALWLPQSSGTTYRLNGLTFVGPNVGTAVGDHGTILRTTDGGVTWTIQTSGTIYNLNDVCFTDSTTGTAVGAWGTILRTTNGGNSWVERSPNDEHRFFDGRLNVLPNPFVSFARIPGHASDRFALYDVSGRKVGVYKGDRIGWDVSPGVYFLRPDPRDQQPDLRIIRVVKLR